MGATNSTNTETKWSWRDALERLQYIDKIIRQIVSGAILINTFLLATYCALNAVYAYFAILIVSFFGIIINTALAMNLARQEYIRQWYFRLLPENRFPVMPHKKWLEEDITNTYETDYLKRGDTIKKADERFLIWRLGKIRGYCVLWFWVLIFIASLFSLHLLFMIINQFVTIPTMESVILIIFH